MLCHWRFHHRSINALPSPGNAFKFVVLSQPQFPQGFKDSCLFPLEKAGMDCVGTAESLGGQRLPLTSRAQNKHNAFEDQPGIFWFAPAAGFSGVSSFCNTLTYRNQRLNTTPKLIGDFPCFGLAQTAVRGRNLQDPDLRSGHRVTGLRCGNAAPKRTAITRARAIENMGLLARRQRVNLQLPDSFRHWLGNQPRYNWKQSLAPTAL